MSEKPGATGGLTGEQQALARAAEGLECVSTTRTALSRNMIAAFATDFVRRLRNSGVDAVGDGLDVEQVVCHVTSDTGVWPRFNRTEVTLDETVDCASQ